MIRLPVAMITVGILQLVACAPTEHSCAPTSALFTEITDEVGLGKADSAWPDGTFFLPEIMGPGVGLLDYDGDGDLDILQPRVPPPGRPAAEAANRLYRQEPDGSFVDVTAEAGVGHPGFGQGLAIGDMNGNGHPDVYFANYGPDALYFNNGDGTFARGTERAGIADDRWSAGATLCDYDRDGDLDLYVVHYLSFDYEGACRAPSGIPDYCGPHQFDGVPDTLWQNAGDGTFVDVTRPAGIRLTDGKRAKGLAAVCLDLTDDGFADIYVANDGEANQLWVNQGDGTFRDQAVMMGVAVNRHGHPEASMGLAVGDVDADGGVDLFMTHLALEHNTLYLRDRGRLFVERTVESRLSKHDLAFTGFGCALFDLDHDGDLDLALVNGRVRRDASDAGSTSTFWDSYGESNLLLANAGQGRFSDLTGSGGSLTSRIEVSRGLAVGDLDRDGDLDLVSSNADNTLRVYRNDAPLAGRHWLAVAARTSGRDAIGARVVVHAGGRARLGAILPGQSYMSSHEPVAHFGLGEIDRFERIELTWPDGSQEAFEGSAADRRIVVQQGEGQPL